VKIQPQWVVTPGKQTNKQDGNLLHFKNSYILHSAHQQMLTHLLLAVYLLAYQVAHPFLTMCVATEGLNVVIPELL